MKRLLIALALIGVIVSPAPAQIGTVMPVPVIQFVDQNGVPLSGGLLYTYAAGTVNPLATYSDSGLSVPNANPVVLDTAGRATIYLSAATYKFILKTSAGVTVWTQDNVAAAAPWNLNTFTGKVQFTAPAVLTVTSNAVTPTGNVQALDTAGGAVNLNTINTTNTANGFVLYLYGNTPVANPVTVKNGAGNIVLRKGDFALNSANRFVVLQLIGTTWYELGRSDLDGAVMGPQLKSYTETENAVSISGTTLTLDLSTGNHFKVSLNAQVTSMVLSNPPASGVAFAFTFVTVGDGTAHGFVWNANIKWPSGSAPTITTTLNKTDIYTFLTFDGGTTWWGFIGGQNF